MAEGGGGGGLLQVTVNFEGSRTVLHLPRNMKIGLAIQKAAEHFKQDPKGLTFLYHGLEITDDMPVGVALAQASSVTAIHLIRASAKKTNTATVQVGDGKREAVYGHCKECGFLVASREVFVCKRCNSRSLFQRSSSIPINHFAPEIESGLLEGACGKCNSENIQAAVEFECTACDDGTTVCPLRQIRTNMVHHIPCMKCGKKEDLVFRFACRSRHCMCVECFSKMCTLQLKSDGFRNFDNMGYSVSCPGPGQDCKLTPVPDPHHFKIVACTDFYEKFKEKSITQYQPQGDNIMCAICKTEIDFTRSKEAEVTEPPGSQPPNVSGLRWYHKMLGMKPTPPAPRVRRRASCGKCQLMYCAACKQVWHEGDCSVLSDDIIKEEKAYTIEPSLASRACWPKEE